MVEYTAYVGLDVHKETIAVAIALPGREEPMYRGEIANKRSSLRRLVRNLSPYGEVLSFAYEAGPCGYGVYRELVATGHDCMVVAPSLVPRKAGDRVKTDRRDALNLARLHRAGELRRVWVPDADQEAMRDLTRAGEDMKAIELKSRQRLGAFLLRHERIYAGRSRWTQAHFRWLEEQSFEHPMQQVVFQEYVDAVLGAQRRVAGLDEQIHQAVATWSLRPLVEALISLRGVNVLTAVTVLAELGDLTRFDNPRQLMSHLGLVPSEHSSGLRRRQGGITKTGNGHVRRVLIEAWRRHYNAVRPHSSLGYRPSPPDTIVMPSWPPGSAALRRSPTWPRKRQCTNIQSGPVARGGSPGDRGTTLPPMITARTVSGIPAILAPCQLRLPGHRRGSWTDKRTRPSAEGDAIPGRKRHEASVQAQTSSDPSTPKMALPYLVVVANSQYHGVTPEAEMPQRKSARQSAGILSCRRFGKRFEILSTQCLGGLMVPDDVADLCLFLTSPLACNTPARASWSTGARFSRESLLYELVS